MITSINLKALSGAVLAAMSAYIPASVLCVVDRIEQDGGDRIAVVEIADNVAEAEVVVAVIVVEPKVIA